MRTAAAGVLLDNGEDDVRHSPGGDPRKVSPVKCRKLGEAGFIFVVMGGGGGVRGRGGKGGGAGGGGGGGVERGAGAKESTAGRGQWERAQCWGGLWWAWDAEGPRGSVRQNCRTYVMA